MEDKYLNDNPRPDFDSKISTFIKNEFSPYGGDYKIGIIHNGEIYRVFYGSLGDIMEFTDFIYDFGLFDTVGLQGMVKGYSALFDTKPISQKL